MSGYHSYVLKGKTKPLLQGNYPVPRWLGEGIRGGLLAGKAASVGLNALGINWQVTHACAHAHMHKWIRMFGTTLEEACRLALIGVWNRNCWNCTVCPRYRISSMGLWSGVFIVVHCRSDLLLVLGFLLFFKAYFMWVIPVQQANKRACHSL